MSEIKGMSEVNEGMTGAVNSRHLNFHGVGVDYFIVCLINLGLIIITGGIYAAWALVRSKRYFYSNTELAGSRFAYHAKGSSVFISFLCLMVLILSLEFAIINQKALPIICLSAFLIFLLPYLICKSIRYQMQSTTLNNVRFNFSAPVVKSWWVINGCPLLMMIAVVVLCGAILSSIDSASLFVDVSGVITTVVVAVVVGLLGMGIVQGVSYALWLNLLLNNLSFGKSHFTAVVSMKKCITICLVAILIPVPFVILVIKLAAPAYLGLIMGGLSDPEFVEKFQSTILLCYAIYFVAAMLFYSYFYVTMRNYYYQTVVLDEKIYFRSTLTIFGFLWQSVSNILLASCTLGIGYPWARVRFARYLAQNTWVDGDLDSLNLEDHEDKIATDIVSRLSRGLVPNINL